MNSSVKWDKWCGHCTGWEMAAHREERRDLGPIPGEVEVWEGFLGEGKDEKESWDRRRKSLQGAGTRLHQEHTRKWAWGAGTGEGGDFRAWGGRSEGWWGRAGKGPSWGGSHLWERQLKAVEECKGGAWRARFVPGKGLRLSPVGWHGGWRGRPLASRRQQMWELPSDHFSLGKRLALDEK